MLTSSLPVLPALFMIGLGASACARPGRLEPSCDPRVHLAVTVRGDSVREVTWTPDCDVGWVHVGRPDRNEVTWQIQTRDSTNAIGNPIVYGLTPPIAIELHQSVDLERGVEYRVSLGRFFDTSRGRVIILLGQLVFRH